MRRRAVRIVLGLCLLLAGQGLYATVLATAAAAGDGAASMQDCEHGMPDDAGRMHLPCCTGHGFCPVMQAQLPTLPVAIDVHPFAARFLVRPQQQASTRTPTPLLRPPITFSL